MKSYTKIILGLIVIWFILALTASAQHLFLNPSGRIGVSVAVAASLPVLIFLLWFAAAPGFRQFALGLDPGTLTLVQATRIAGFVFPLLQARHVLPAIFALPAGYGDMFIGITATAAAWKLANPNHRQSFILWQCLGILDLLLAVALGTTAGITAPNDASMLPITVLPLSLIPTFFVPLYLILHLICIAQAKAWTASVSNPRHASIPQTAPSAL